jgi:CubicO group peptidase (beta-lactamase class C family)
VSHGWGDLELQPRDMAKLGYLWLHDGRWEGRQVIPAGYLAEALTRHVSVEPGIDYGYGMWLYPGHTPVDFEANGTGGQRITVIPSLDMVEVMTGGGFDANEVQNLIAAAPKADSALPPNPAADERLASLAAELAEPPSDKAVTIDNSGAVPIPKPKPLPPLRATTLAAETAVPIPRANPARTKS